MITLRPYQSELIDRLRATMKGGSRAPLLVLPTGGGKTVLFSYFARQANLKGKRVLILAHRDELIEQISGTLKQFDVKHSFISADRWFLKEHMTHVGSVFTVIRRLAQTPRPDVIITDECHHAITDSTWGKVLTHFSHAWRIGVTATPQRLGGEPLSDMFDSMILGPNVRELITLGALSDYRIFAPSRPDLTGVHTRMGEYARGELAAALDRPSITGSALEHYKKLSPGKRAIVFCVSVEHARNVARDFQAAGFKAASVDGTLHRDARGLIIKSFRDGDLQILTSCDLVGEGLDVPGIEVAILLRPTQSLSLYLQQVGRSLRPFPGKTEALILDHAGNTQKHGLPDDERPWSLDSPIASTRNSKGDSVSVRICDKCFAAQAPSPACKFCGHVFPVQAREVEEREGELVELTKEQLARQKTVRMTEQTSSKSRDDLIRLGRSRGYKSAERWADHILAAREKKKLERMNHG